MLGPGGLQSDVLSAFGAQEAFKVLYCLRGWPWRAPKCCTVSILGPGALLSAVLSAFLGPATLQSAELYAFQALEAFKVL